MENMYKRILLTIIMGIILIVVFYSITNAITKHTGFLVSDLEEDDFKKCLREQDINLYLNTGNLANTLKDIKLIEDLEYVKIKNCLRDKEGCVEKEVDSFPTWIINNKKIDRDISFEEFSEYSGCKLIIK